MLTLRWLLFKSIAYLHDCPFFTPAAYVIASLEPSHLWLLDLLLYPKLWSLPDDLVGCGDFDLWGRRRKSEGHDQTIRDSIAVKGRGSFRVEGGFFNWEVRGKRRQATRRVRLNVRQVLRRFHLCLLCSYATSSPLCRNQGPVSYKWFNNACWGSEWTTRYRAMLLRVMNM